jgi:NAD(P)H-flavin reductase
MQKNDYLSYQMKVTAIKGLCADTKALRLEFADKKQAKEFNFQPGQFLFLSMPGYGEGIFAFTTASYELPTIEVAVRSVGNLTRAVHRLKVGDVVGIRGPYGKPFPFDKFYGRELLVIAGGIGLAPLRSLIHTIEKEPKNVGELKIFCGAKKPEDFLYKDELAKWKKFAEVNLSVNEADGAWKGMVGLVTDLFDKTEIKKESVAVLCGPPAMFGPVIEKLKKFGVKEENIYAMLERRMKCGIGKCQHCTCGDKYVCIDGPTFCWTEIKKNWEALV